MATPIAHEGSVAGANVHAHTLLDLLLRPELVEDAWSYFNDVQSKQQVYIPFISDTDEPAIFLNQEIMQRYRPLMEPYYYDPTRFDSYLEQLGIAYPTVREKPIA
jgi:aminobenzoyl-glutamate utilization protein B